VFSAANEIATCIFDFIKSNAAKGIKHFNFWSDNCGGQNKNKFMMAMMIYGSKILSVNIRHSFLEKGHTQMEVDSIHGNIE
jgi:hypothetical protein